MNLGAAAIQNYSVYTANSVTEFMDYLLPNSKHWRSAKRGDLAYRGQASSRWALVPKAFRRDEMIGYGSEAPRGRSTRVTRQSRAEFSAVHEFVKVADASGLDIPEPGGGLLLQEDPRYIFDDPNWEYRWPQREVLETLALAQHHGVPIRLLDFTEDPTVAAYFAASSAWDAQRCRRISGEGRSHLAVWIVDLRFVRAINGISSRYLERIGEVRVPRANNSYLHAQGGFFLVDRGANDVMTQTDELSLEDALADRSRFWHTGARLSGKHLSPKWFDETPIRQVRLCTIYADDLLRELQDRGSTRATLMPSLDRVVESLEIGRSLPMASDATLERKHLTYQRFLRRYCQSP